MRLQKVFIKQRVILSLSYRFQDYLGVKSCDFFDLRHGFFHGRRGMLAKIGLELFCEWL